MNKNEIVLAAAIFCFIADLAKSEVTPCNPLPQALTFAYGSKASIDVCLKGDQRPALVFTFGNGNETDARDDVTSLDNAGRRFHFVINLPKLQSEDCGKFLTIRYFDDERVLGEHRLTVSVADIPLNIHLLSYQYTEDGITRITWTPIQTGHCQPVQYFVRIQEFSGKYTHFGPLDKISWQTDQMIAPHRISVYAKDGSRKGEPSIDIFQISGEQMDADTKDNSGGASQSQLFSSSVWVGLIVGACVLVAFVTVFITCFAYRKKLRRHNSSVKYVKSYTDLPERYHLENRTQSSGKYASLAYVQPNIVIPPADHQLPTDNGYECNDSYYETTPRNL